MDTKALVLLVGLVLSGCTSPAGKYWWDPALLGGHEVYKSCIHRAGKTFDNVDSTTEANCYKYATGLRPMGGNSVLIVTQPAPTTPILPGINNVDPTLGYIAPSISGAPVIPGVNAPYGSRPSRQY